MTYPYAAEADEALYHEFRLSLTEADRFKVAKLILARKQIPIDLQNKILSEFLTPKPFNLDPFEQGRKMRSQKRKTKLYQKEVIDRGSEWYQAIYDQNAHIAIEEARERIRMQAREQARRQHLNRLMNERDERDRNSARDTDVTINSRPRQRFIPPSRRNRSRSLSRNR